MSRSYKKTPIIKDNGKSKKASKKIANSKVKTRLKQSIENEALDLSDGKAYKKISETWSIADYVARWSEQDAREYYTQQCTLAAYSNCVCPEEQLQKFLSKYPTVEDYLNKVWAPACKRK